MSSKTAPDSPRPWSLATRLTLWYAASSFVLLAASAGFMYGALVYSLESEDDQFMAEKVELVRRLLGRAGQPVVLPKDEQRASSIHLRVIAPNGEVHLKTAGVDEELPADQFPPPETSVRGRERWLPDGRCFRVASLRTPDYVIQMALDRTQEEHTLAAYRRNLMIVLGLALLGSVVLGYGIARRGIRPVEAIAATARHVRSSTLSERIALAGLPAELSTLAESFNAMLDRLEQSFDQLRRFSADIAHELRTPVNNLRGELEVALGKPRPPEEYREVLSSGLEECGRLAGMIDSLLFLARAENPRTQIDKEPLDVGRELATVCEFYEAAAAEAGVRLTAEPGGGRRVNLSRSLFQRAVSNLVANALAHTPPGGAVTLRTTADHATVRVEVADTGRGIPPEHLAHVFERFYRVDVARTAGGLGLGLALVRSIVELHGGTVEIASEVGKGTRVTMLFPAADGGAVR